MAIQSRDRFRKQGFQLVLAGGVVAVVVILLLWVSTMLQTHLMTTIAWVLAIALGSVAVFSLLGGAILMITADRS
jgi:hypothetical protein